jgi:hypothetical protein
MKIMKWIIALILLAVAAFCLFGFLATYEPGVASAMAFRVGYAAIGICCLLGAAWSILRRSNAS